MKCPECKENLKSTFVRSAFGNPTMNLYCEECGIVSYGHEHPDVTRGREMERSGQTKNIDITSLPPDVELGILRQRQNP